MFSNNSMFWNVRDTPKLAILSGCKSAISSSKMRIDPLVGLYIPFIQFKIEVLPAPLGPIIAKSEFSLISNDTFFNACTPPNLKLISLKEITTLTNLFENYSASELVDASLSKNMKKTCEILNENNYSSEDIFLILRVFLQKTKKLLNLIENLNNNKNVEKAISEYRPPIFWKDKPIIERQLQIWSFEGVKNLIYKINDLETKIKKDNSLSLILMKNFIYEIISNKTNNSFLLTQ